jgi:glycosyltransferase involved in cell wall biosynthesis
MSKKLLLINSILNTGSTGRITEEIGILASRSGFQTSAAHGNFVRNSELNVLKIGSKISVFFHGVESRLFDNHGFASRKATRDFITELEQNIPDIVHLHNIHGYFLNVEILFNFLKKNNIPIVWTFHDCWPFTGHCSYFDGVNCNKWETVCNKCPNKAGYPKTYFDFSERNFLKKKNSFTGHNNLTIVTPSAWLAQLVKKSFLQEYPVKVINNGVDIEIFKPYFSQKTVEKYKLQPFSKIVLGVASTWDKRKGLSDFIELSLKLPKDVRIVLVGLRKAQLNEIPAKITGIPRTENASELAELYSMAHVFVNPTYVDNFPTTNIEALACGTPVVTYKTGGSPESIDNETGLVVEKGDLNGLYFSLMSLLEMGKTYFSDLCRKRAVEYYDKNNKFLEYIDLYKQILK